ncbi:cupin domain-containing protein [Nocardia fluminea]|uniref:cupin domain-containing protein n=1 Tax=Nocardia fluminea TaxID=134984 RepID=UPI0037151B53
MATPIEDLPLEVAQGEMQTRYIELGDMAVRHARVPAGTDFGPVLQGLPDDRCPSPHWGIVLEGSLRLEHADGTVETANAGEVYYWPAGHTATSAGGAVFLEVGPVAPMRQFHDHALRLFG